MARFYARGTAGGDHDHRHLDCAAVAGGAGGPRGGPPDAVPEQPQANGARLPQPREAKASARGGWRLRLGGRPRPRLRQAAARRLASTTSCLHRAAGAARLGVANDVGSGPPTVDGSRTPLGGAFICPTRRRALTYPFVPHFQFTGQFWTCRRHCAGATMPATPVITPTLSPTVLRRWPTETPTTPAVAGSPPDVRRHARERRVLGPQHVPDTPTSPTASSNTYLVGERYLCTDSYTTGEDPADDQGWCIGFDIDKSAAG